MGSFNLILKHRSGYKQQKKFEKTPKKSKIPNCFTSTKCKKALSSQNQKENVYTNDFSKPKVPVFKTNPNTVDDTCNALKLVEQLIMFLEFRGSKLFYSTGSVTAVMLRKLIKCN